LSVTGTVLVERYRLEERLSGPDPVQGSLWRGVDLLAGEIPVVIRQLESQVSKQRLQRYWPELQAILHPQIPRCGEQLELDGALWTVRDWQEGVSYAQLLQQREQRQMLFGPGEVLLLLRQLLPVLAVVHGRGLVHGDVNPRNLLRRSADGLPVLLDFGLVQAEGEDPLAGATPGYAPRAQGRGETCAAWMDLHGLGVSSLVLLTGQPPEQLLSPFGESWCWPEQLQLTADFKEVLQRLLSEDPQRRFADAVSALALLKSVPMPEQSGPIARADRTVPLAPVASAAAEPALPSLTPAASPSRRLSRVEERDLGAEGRLWPVVVALALSALVGSAIGWFLLSRNASVGKAPSTATDVVGQPQPASLPPAEVDERQQLLSRLRALQVDRAWFLTLVNTAVLDRFPERGGRLPSDDLEDAPLRRVWNELAEDWLARIEQLPPALRSRLGSLKQADWSEQRAGLVKQGVTPRAVEQLVSAGARDLLPGDARGRQPQEPYRQLWYAAAIESLRDVQIEQVTARPRIATNLSLRIPAGGARLISVEVPTGAGLVLGINGTPLMEMTVFGADGAVRAERGPLRVSTLPPDLGSPVQVLITNDGVSSGSLTLSCRADRPRSQPQKPVLERRRRVPLPDVDTDPIVDSASGE
jgi:serine/threonine-protein kinase